jgi:peptidoglycan biosynthesis protein MviN/MurJ (putative lipid II flippase)
VLRPICNTGGGVIVANLGVIRGGWLLAPRFRHRGFAIGLGAGNFFSFFVLQAIAVWRLGDRFRPNLDFQHPGFRMFLRRAIPLMLMTDDWYLRRFESFLALASITWVASSKALMRMPLMVTDLGVASFHFSRNYIRAANLTNGMKTMKHTTKGMLLFLVPISALTMVLSTPVVSQVFSHTRTYRNGASRTFPI